MKVVEPFDVVEIAFVAQKMKLPQEEVGVIGVLDVDCAEIVADDSG